MPLATMEKLGFPGVPRKEVPPAPWGDTVHPAQMLYTPSPRGKELQGQGRSNPPGRHQCPGSNACDKRLKKALIKVRVTLSKHSESFIQPHCCLLDLHLHMSVYVASVSEHFSRLRPFKWLLYSTENIESSLACKDRPDH